MENHIYYRSLRIHFQQDYIGWFFPIEDLRLATETVKRILTKKKIDTQLAGQSSPTPFMNIKDGYISKKATFNT